MLLEFASPETVLLQDGPYPGGEEAPGFEGSQSFLKLRLDVLCFGRECAVCGVATPNVECLFWSRIVGHHVPPYRVYSRSATASTNEDGPSDQKDPVGMLSERRSHSYPDPGGRRAPAEKQGEPMARLLTLVEASEGLLRVKVPSYHKGSSAS